MSLATWFENRWSHIAYGLKKNLVDVAAFLAPIQKELAPILQEDLDTILGIVGPVVIHGLETQQKPLDIAHTAGNAVLDQLPVLSAQIGTSAIQAIVATVQAAHKQAATGDTAPPANLTPAAATTVSVTVSPATNDKAAVDTVS